MVRGFGFEGLVVRCYGLRAGEFRAERFRVERFGVERLWVGSG